MGVVGDVALEWMLMWNWLKPLCTRASSQSLGPTCTSPPEGDAKKCRCAAMLGTSGSADATVAPVMRTPVAMVRTIRYRIDLLLAPRSQFVDSLLNCSNFQCSPRADLSTPFLRRALAGCSRVAC